MKVIETKSIAEEIKLMAWSPKMDLIALGCDTGDIFLHRLSWQRIWQVKLAHKSSDTSFANPDIITWHPEGIFLCVAAGPSTFIIDVESGKIIHSHEMPTNIVAMNWCTSNYDVSPDEAIAAQPRQQPDFLRNDLKIQRLESHLSILVLGTENGIVHLYTGGFLLASILKKPLPLDFPVHGSCETLHVDITKNFESTLLLVLTTTNNANNKQESMLPPPSSSSSSSSQNGNSSYLCFSHFKNELIEKIAPVLGPLGFKYLFFNKNWSLIQSELSSLNDEWSKLVDMYKNYMTYGQEKDFEEVRADYMELLFTGISTVEMEIYLGKGGREKEVKRNATTMNSVHGVMSDHIKNTKSALVFMQTELNELGGFLNQVGRVDEAKAIISELRKSLSYIYLATLHVQYLVETFLDVFHDFIHLILNTIHIINNQETPDFIEEDADVDKILKFLDMKIDKGIFEFLLNNSSIIFGQKPPSCFEPIELPKSASKRILAEKKPPVFPYVLPPNTTTTTKEWKSFHTFMTEFLEERVEVVEAEAAVVAGEEAMDTNGNDDTNKPEINIKRKPFIGQDFILDFSQEKVVHLLKHMSSTVDGLIKKLFAIPVLCTVPFIADTYIIADIQNSTMYNHNNVNEIRQCTGLLTNSLTRKSLAYLLWDLNTVYLFEYDFSTSYDTPRLKAHGLTFTHKVTCVDFFSECYLSILTFDDSSATTTTTDSSSSSNYRSILCQLNLDKIDEKSTSPFFIDMKQFLTVSKQLKGGGDGGIEPGEVIVDIPKDISKLVSANTSSNLASCLEYAFLVANFKCSKIMAVSGARKVGAFMAESKKSIVLVDMELEVPENSFDEGDTANDEYSSESIEVTLSSSRSDYNLLLFIGLCYVLKKDLSL